MFTAKTFVPTALLVLGLGWGLTTVTAQDDEPPTALEAAMGTLQGGMKELRPLIGDPKTHEKALVAKLHEMQAAALSAVANPPAAPEGFREGGEFTWRIGYQRKVLELADALFECESGVFRGRAEEVKAAYDRANEIKKLGHDTWK